VKAGAFVFGSGLAIEPFPYGGVVREHGWLNDRQFLDAVAVAMLTPEPVVITVAFIGYLVACPPGALVAALGVVVDKVVRGGRTDLKLTGAGPGAYGVKVAVARHTWHESRVDFEGAEAGVTLHGSCSSRVATRRFPTPERWGVWSKADSVTEFAQFESGAS
jgi:hypothetical protein